MSAQKIFHGLIQARGKTVCISETLGLGIASGCITSLSRSNESKLPIAYVIPKGLQLTKDMPVFTTKGNVVTKPVTGDFFHFKLGHQYSPLPIDDKPLSVQQQKIAQDLSVHNVAVTKVTGQNHPDAIINVNPLESLYKTARLALRSAAQQGIASIAFPSETIAMFGISQEQAAKELLEATNRHKEKYPELIVPQIVLAIDDRNTPISLTVFKERLGEYLAENELGKPTIQAEPQTIHELMNQRKNPFPGDPSYTLGQTTLSTLPQPDNVIARS